MSSDLDTEAPGRGAVSSERDLDQPMYPPAETGRLVGLSSGRVQRWLSGYTYNYKDERHTQVPVIRRGGTMGTRYASFLDLIDLLFVKRFLDHKVSLQKLRKALDEAAQLLHTNHFARRSFFTDEKRIYLEVKEEGNAILELLSGGQWVIPDVIRELGHQIDFDAPSGLARRWYPLGPGRHVVLDPFVSFGRPHISGKGVATANVVDFYLAEDRRLGQVCRWLNLTRAEVNDAVEFEERLAA